MPFLWLLFCHWPLWKLLYEIQFLFFSQTKSKINPDKSSWAAVCWLPQTRVTQPQTIRSLCSGLGMGLIVHHTETCWNRFAGQRLPQYLLHLCLLKTAIIHADRATHSSKPTWGVGEDAVTAVHFLLFTCSWETLAEWREAFHLHPGGAQIKP